MSKSRRTKQREQIGFMLSVIALVVIVGLLLFGEPTPTRWMLLVAAVAVTRPLVAVLTAFRSAACKVTSLTKTAPVMTGMGRNAAAAPLSVMFSTCAYWASEVLNTVSTVSLE